jgi:hypothetical protein
MSALSRSRGAARRWLLCGVWLTACGGTDVVARAARGDVPCFGLDAGCGVDAGLPDAEADAAKDADAGPDTATDAAEAGRDADAATDSETPPDAGCRARVCNVLSSADALCRSSGVVIQAGDRCESSTSTAPTSRYALCSCSDLVSATTLSTDSFAGTLLRPVANAANIGVNADLDLGGTGNIDGELRVMGRRNLSSNVLVDALTPVSEAPCSCEPTRLLDIEALVLAHKKNHDNAREGFSEALLDGFRGPKELSLPCGRYYFTRLKSEDPLVIHTRGNVAIFVENNIELNDSLSIQSDGDSGEVNLFVAGEAHVGGALHLGGDPNGKTRANLYLQGNGTLELSGSTDITGNVYAPRAELVNVGIFQLYGSLFVRRAAPAGELHIHYDTSATSATQCELAP